MKYEMIFGDAGLFDCAGLFTGIDVVTRNVEHGLYALCRLSNLTNDELKANPVVAMRRIIKEPVWTKADQEKGILPTVGCLCIEGMYLEEVIAVTSKYIVTKTKTDGVCTTSIEAFKRTYRPIETPREKYDRERDECIDKLLAKIPPSPITVVPAMKIVYEELRPFTGDKHD